MKEQLPSDTILARRGFAAGALLASALAVGSAAATVDGTGLEALEARHPGAAAFVADVAERHGLDPAWVAEALAGATRQDGIIRAISRPAEGKPWHEYRKIFLTDARIAGGRAFLAEHAALLAEVESRYGVPREMVAAIVGVETSYGRITGSYRVLDALATLAFHYPRRAAFFRRELEELLLLSREERLPLGEVQGSYAGAMGLGQFIPSSYRAYAVDHDGDGRRDLWGSEADAIASVANYFAVHRWQPGEPVAVPAVVVEDARELQDLPLVPRYPAVQLAEWGYVAPPAVRDQRLATVVELDGEAGTEHWIAFQNFYVITRYNRSPLYAMAVHQLAEALRAAMPGEPLSP